jgi:hypothetical protein
VVPAPLVVRDVGEGGQLLRRREAQVICLQLDGQWLPLEHVAVNYVGKFRYTLQVGGGVGWGGGWRWAKAKRRGVALGWAA